MVTPYLTFEGDCGEALLFYKNAFNGTIKTLRYYDDYVPEDVKAPPYDLEDWILHAEMEIYGTTFWFADEVSEPVIKGNMVRLTLLVDDAAEAQRVFDSLNHHAFVPLPPTETFYSTFHASIVDQFGINWNITALEAPDPSPQL